MRRIAIVFLIAAIAGCDAGPEATYGPELYASVTPAPHYVVTIIRETLGGQRSRQHDAACDPVARRLDY